MLELHLSSRLWHSGEVVETLTLVRTDVGAPVPDTFRFPSRGSHNALATPRSPAETYLPRSAAEVELGDCWGCVRRFAGRAGRDGLLLIVRLDLESRESSSEREVPRSVHELLALDRAPGAVLPDEEAAPRHLEPVARIGIGKRERFTDFANTRDPPVRSMGVHEPIVAGILGQVVGVEQEHGSEVIAIDPKAGGSQ